VIEFGTHYTPYGQEVAALPEESEYGIEWLRKELDQILATYQTPHERRVGYGNLRHEYSTWKREGEEITNIAIIYETPGGSTTQLNITYNHQDGTFTYLDSELGDCVVTRDSRDALQVIHDHVAEIPAKRQAALNRQVDQWMGEGKTSSEVFAELNKLLTNEFLGGRVTTTELKSAIQHAIKRKAEASAAPS
jgi:hypothetical protein